MSSYSKGKEFELRTKAILEEILDKSELELKLQNFIRHSAIRQIT